MSLNSASSNMGMVVHMFSSPNNSAWLEVVWYGTNSLYLIKCAVSQYVDAFSLFLHQDKKTGFFLFLGHMKRQKLHIKILSVITVKNGEDHTKARTTQFFPQVL